MCPTAAFASFWVALLRPCGAEALKSDFCFTKDVDSTVHCEALESGDRPQSASTELKWGRSSSSKLEGGGDQEVC